MRSTVDVTVTVDRPGQEPQAVAADLRTALLGLAMDTPYEVTDVQLTSAPGAPDVTSPEYRAGWAAQEQDAQMIADAHAKLETELAAEDAAWDGRGLQGEDGDDDELGLFASRLLGWLNSQPDVMGSAEIIMDTGPNDRKTSADIIIGVSIAAIGGVSMSMNITP